MALTLNLYQITKRNNSTYNVNEHSISPRLSVPVKLKDGTSIINPIFMISCTYNITLIDKINYCELLGESSDDIEIVRYYFIDDIIINNGYVELSCKEDVLATFKDYIGDETQYILRSSNPLAYAYGSEFTDLTYPTKQGYNLLDKKGINVFNYAEDLTGWFCVGILAPNATPDDNTEYVATRGAVTYVAMTKVEVENLIDELLTLRSDQADINPLQFLVSCVYIPDDDITISATHTYVISYSGQTILFNYKKNPYLNENGVGSIYVTTSLSDIQIPNHPDALTRGKYLNYAPFMHTKMFAGPFGVVELPLNEITPLSQFRLIKIIIDVDFTTGMGCLRVYDGQISGNKVIQMLNAQVGVPVQLAQIVTGSQTGTYNVIQSLWSSLGAAVSKNFFGAISGMANAVMASWEDSLPRVNTSGTNGSLVNLTYDLQLITTYLSQAEENLEDIGRVVNKRLIIDSMQDSFILCSDSDIDNIPCFETERVLIKNYMDTGFFYE